VSQGNGQGKNAKKKINEMVREKRTWEINGERVREIIVEMVWHKKVKDMAKEKVKEMAFDLAQNMFKDHYEKLCPRQLDYPTSRTPKQLIHNCIATVPWKYDK
jgi:hypothetical protein